MEHGLGIRVDRRSDARAGAHRAGADAAAEGSESSSGPRRSRENAAAARDPEQVLATLTRNNATFSERDLDRHLGKHIADEAEALAVTGRRCSATVRILPLYDPETGEAAGRYTTKTVRAQEAAALADAGEVAGAAGHRGRRQGAGRGVARTLRRTSARRSTMRSTPAG